ncbi:GNAT family N-acetyltransferase [Catellatospora sp. KI3]|uniref:GNAT family N-acetyltransferase n=1 Tax=Catellatospora sp. KI3 TaxID=3041620 RepID=UPI002482A26E|nr:GNAT family N-acetyltransferase [Catellatospora sp. KI3]MDI1465698.1 GNAT family N-acetyltransferase [Catellatospora sp. KI3]
MPVHSVHDRAELAELLGRDPARYAYQLGDLDDFFWPYTTWYRRGDALALVYHGGGLPTLLAFDPDGPGTVAPLLRDLLPLLPGRLYAHLSPGAESELAAAYRLEPGGPHLKMALTDPAALAAAEPLGDVLGPGDLPELSELYDAAYPGNWFDRRMLETGQYVGVRRDGRLAAVAGIHVWSPAYRVSALGNVTTRPELRGQGLARGVVAALCRRLRETVDHVTLNVHAGNAAALALYDRLGFTPIAEYGEFTCSAR